MKVLTLALLCIASVLGCTRSRPPIEPAIGSSGSGSPMSARTKPAATAGSRSDPLQPSTPPPRDAGTVCAPDSDCAQPMTATDASAPLPAPDSGVAGAPADPVCGNGVIEGKEACELICSAGPNPICTAALRGNSCQNLGFTSGVLGCSSCQLDTRGCGKCGDGNIQEGEDCEGSDLLGMNCVGLGFAAGALNCDPNSCRYDTSMCVPVICFRTRVPCRSGGF